MKTLNSKYQALVNDLKQANQVAIEADPKDDGGTCNFDSPVIHLRGVRKATIQEIEKLSGIKLTDFHSRFFGAGSYWIGVTTYGQANQRTVMAEAAYKFLKDKGYEVSIYYQMD